MRASGHSTANTALGRLDHPSVFVCSLSHNRQRHAGDNRCIASAQRRNRAPWSKCPTDISESNVPLWSSKPFLPWFSTLLHHLVVLRNRATEQSRRYGHTDQDGRISFGFREPIVYDTLAPFLTSLSICSPRGLVFAASLFVRRALAPAAYGSL